jgi:hypothetical protein
VALKAPSTVGTSLTWTLPATDGGSGQVLCTNASGVLGWRNTFVLSGNTGDILYNNGSNGITTTACFSYKQNSLSFPYDNIWLIRSTDTSSDSSYYNNNLLIGVLGCVSSLMGITAENNNIIGGGWYVSTTNNSEMKNNNSVGGFAYSVNQSFGGNENNSIGVLCSSRIGNNNVFMFKENSLNATETSRRIYGSCNVYIGTEGRLSACRDFNYDGDQNIGIGGSILGNVNFVTLGATGSDNIAIGRCISYCDGICSPAPTRVYRNIVVANDGLSGVGDICDNIMIGSCKFTCFSGKNCNNIAIGAYAMARNSCARNWIAIGIGAGRDCHSASTQYGISAGVPAGTYCNNIYIGCGSGQFNYPNAACANITGLAVDVGSFNTAIGSDSFGATTTTRVGCYNLAIGHYTGSNANYCFGTAIGCGNYIYATNTLKIGNDVTNTAITGNVVTSSDCRNKTDVRPTIWGLDFINALRPVDYRWDHRSDYADGTPDGSKKGTRFHSGLLAQEVQAAADAAGEDFAGVIHWSYNGISQGPEEFGLKYDYFYAPLIRAVQELSVRTKQLEAQWR